MSGRKITPREFTCMNCGKKFTVSAYFSRYCRDCKVIVHRRSNRINAKKLRDEVKDELNEMLRVKTRMQKTLPVDELLQTVGYCPKSKIYK